MNKTEIIRILKETDKNLESIIESSRPDESGILNLKTVKGKPIFYCRTEEGKQKYVRMSDDEQIKRLSSNYYAKRLKAAAIKEKKQIDSCLDILSKDPEESDVDKVAQRIPEAIKANAGLSELSDEGYARKWQQGNKIVKKYRSHKEDDYHKFKTLRGDYVGSKSELIIADRLYVKGIPYHYEIAFTPEAEIDVSRPIYDQFGFIAGYEVIGFSPFDQDTLHPDFYVLNKRTRKAYFWEHLGKMDDPSYCLKNFNRFMRIIDAGYIIGEDLIVTHEDSKHPLMTESIDAIIEKYLM
ncbi:MAG: hypothetical protein IIU44_00195 [Spirochaetales bacterium]|nr:hypothetical protein [Spirochaetales bacterium]